MPTLSTHLATCSGVRLTFTPSASKTSALPQVEDTERPPCLATLAPAAAAINALTVDTLNVCMPSPPVPHVSIKCGLLAICTLLESSRMTLAAAAISSTVSPLIRRAINNPAICAWVSSPAITSRIKDCITVKLKFSPLMT